MLVKLFVGKDSSFLETLRTLADLNIGKASGVEMGVCEVVGGQNFWCDVFAVDTHILEDFHVRTKKSFRSPVQ
jgi:hypothetical protein